MRLLKTLTASALCLSLGFAFAACSDDDDNSNSRGKLPSCQCENEDCRNCTTSSTYCEDKRLHTLVSGEGTFEGEALHIISDSSVSCPSGTTCVTISDTQAECQ